MGNNTSQAVDTLERLAVQLAGITEAAAQLRQIGSVEGAVKALTAQRDAMQDEVSTAAAQLSAIKAEIATAKQSGRGLIEAATAQAAALVKEADAQAASLIKDAAAKAAVELQAERANREGRLKTVTKQLDDATNKFSAMQEATAKATKEAEAVERRAVAAQEALDKIQAAAKAIGGA